MGDKTNTTRSSREASSETDMNDARSVQVTANKHASGSRPIEIKQTQASGGKFGVIQARHSPSPTGYITDSNGEPVPIDKIIKTANTMSTMLMAHKIALDDDFRLEPGVDISGPLMSLSPIIGSSPSKGATSGSTTGHGQPSLQSKVKDIVHDAYWDVFKEELATQANENRGERKYDVSKQLLVDVRQKMLDLLLPQHTRIKQDLEDRLDSSIIDQLCKAHSLDLKDYARYILDMLSKLCAPVRDEKLAELAVTSDTVQLYRGIMELLEMMRLDFANFTLNRFKPHIKAHSQDYEREKFNELLKQQQNIGIDGLEYTKVWLARAVDKVDNSQGIKDLVNESCNNSDLDHNDELSSSIMEPEGSDGSRSGFTTRDKIIKSDIVTKVLNVAYTELLEWSTDVQKLYPETLLFDEATFNQLGEQYKVLVLTSSILLTTFAFLTKYKLHDNNDFRILAKANVITLLTASYDNQSTQTTGSSSSENKLGTGVQIDHIKLETVAAKLCEDIRQKLRETNNSLLDVFEDQRDLFKGQILDIQSSSNRVRELARRRILEFVETLLTLDVDHERRKFSSKSAPPVSIPLGLNCLADEITLTMAQLVKIIRYNRRVFFEHYQDILIDSISEKMDK